MLEISSVHTASVELCVGSLNFAWIRDKARLGEVGIDAMYVDEQV